MAQRIASGSALVGAAAVTVALAACPSETSKLHEHAQKLQSLRATTRTVAEAWAAGDVSATFARTALEQTYTLLEQERTAIAPSARELANPAAAALAHDSAALADQISALVRDIDSGAATHARRRDADLQTLPNDRP